MSRCEWKTNREPCFERATRRVYTTGEGYRCCEKHWRDERRWRVQHMGADATHVSRLPSDVQRQRKERAG